MESTDRSFYRTHRTSSYTSRFSSLCPYGTHFVFPESMLKMMLPVGSGIFMKIAFQAARKHSKECRSARLDIDWRVRNAVAEWKNRQETEKI